MTILCFLVKNKHSHQLTFSGNHFKLHTHTHTLIRFTFQKYPSEGESNLKPKQMEEVMFKPEPAD